MPLDSDHIDHISLRAVAIIKRRPPARDCRPSPVRRRRSPMSPRPMSNDTMPSGAVRHATEALTSDYFCALGGLGLSKKVNDTTTLSIDGEVGIYNRSSSFTGSEPYALGGGSGTSGLPRPTQSVADGRVRISQRMSVITPSKSPCSCVGDGGAAPRPVLAFVERRQMSSLGLQGSPKLGELATAAARATTTCARGQHRQGSRLYAGQRQSG
jgi:hypothetical protein